MKEIAKVFGERKALITYIAAGDPDLEISKKILITLDQTGADIIEVGIPFSDPLADGPTIQAASQRALQQGTTLDDILAMLTDLKNTLKSPVILMGYYNSILKYGRERFILEAKKAGVSGVIIPDLPFAEDEEFYKSLQTNGLVGILMVAPNTPDLRLKEITSHSSGFVYCVSHLGVTGGQLDQAAEVENYLQRVREYTNLPLALGFGIDGPDKVRQVIHHADGIIIGSALIKIIAKYKDNLDKMLIELVKFVENIKRAMVGRNPWIFEE